ncbi:MAG: glycoside hydrolase family 108 protein [Cytophagales bacterium]
MANFDVAYSHTLKNEGGYQSHSSDKGNYNSKNELVGTNFGISAPTLERYLGVAPTKEMMQNLPLTTAKAIYKKNYWDAYGIGSINDQYTANQLFDSFVMSSPNAVATFVQKAINTIPPFRADVDGIFGNGTRASINLIVKAQKAKQLNDAIAKFRLAYINSLNSSAFYNGWKTRIESFMNWQQLESVAKNSIIPIIAIGLFFFFIISQKKGKK